MCRIGGDSSLYLGGRDGPVGNAGQSAAFKLGTLDRPIVGTGAAAMMTDAAIAVAHDNRIGSAADAAFEQAGQQIGGTPRIQKRPRLRRFPDNGMAFGKRLLLELGRTPSRITAAGNDGNPVHDPFWFRRIQKARRGDTAVR